jgi:hypothetical protein
MTQTERLLELLRDHQPHRTDEILLKVYGSEHMGIARIGARIADLKNLGHNITGYHDPRNRKLYVYKLIPPKEIELPPAFETTNTNSPLFG